VADLRIIDGGGDGDPPVSTRARDPDKRYCRHRSAELDTTARRVYCRACGDELDAFEYLLDLARNWERYDRTVKDAKARAKSATKELDDLRRQVRNAKAQRRRATR